MSQQGDWKMPVPPEGNSLPLSGQTFVISGVLSMGRGRCLDFIKQYGGRVISRLTDKTSYLVIRQKEGYKYRTAMEKKVKVVQEEGLFQLVQKDYLLSGPLTTPHDQQQSCIICLNDTFDVDLFVPHGCKTCRADAWSICKSCHDRLADGICPVCRDDYAPSLRGYEHLVPETRSITLTSRLSIGDMRTISSTFVLLTSLTIVVERAAQHSNAQQLDLGAIDTRLHFPQLQVLILEGLEMKSLVFTSEVFPSLTNLSLDHLEGDCCPFLLNLPELTSISACHTDMGSHADGRDLGQFGTALSKCPKLVKVICCGLRGLGEANFCVLPNVEIMELRNSAGLFELELLHAPRLQQLDISGSRQLYHLRMHHMPGFASAPSSSVAGAGVRVEAMLKDLCAAEQDARVTVDREKHAWESGEKGRAEAIELNWISSDYQAGCGNPACVNCVQGDFDVEDGMIQQVLADHLQGLYQQLCTDARQRVFKQHAGRFLPEPSQDDLTKVRVSFAKCLKLDRNCCTMTHLRRHVRVGVRRLIRAPTISSQGEQAHHGPCDSFSNGLLHLLHAHTTGEASEEDEEASDEDGSGHNDEDDEEASSSSNSAMQQLFSHLMLETILSRAHAEAQREITHERHDHERRGRVFSSREPGSSDEESEEEAEEESEDSDQSDDEEESLPSSSVNDFTFPVGQFHPGLGAGVNSSAASLAVPDVAEADAPPVLSVPSFVPLQSYTPPPPPATMAPLSFSIGTAKVDQTTRQQPQHKAAKRTIKQNSFSAQNETAKENVPPADFQAHHRYQTIVPAGVVAGQVMHITLPDSKLTVECTVPGGVSAGESFQLDLDADMRALQGKLTKDRADEMKKVERGAVALADTTTPMDLARDAEDEKGEEAKCAQGLEAPVPTTACSTDHTFQAPRKTAGGFNFSAFEGVTFKFGEGVPEKTKMDQPARPPAAFTFVPSPDVAIPSSEPSGGMFVFGGSGNALGSTANTKPATLFHDPARQVLSKRT